MDKRDKSQLYGLLAEFGDAEEIVVAAGKAREAGYTRLDAFTPFPVHGLPEAIGFRDVLVPWLIFIGGVCGALAGFGLQYWINAVDYPMDVGGRPFVTWPSFIPVTFECTVLFAAFAAVIGMLILNGLPRPHHPLFNSDRFGRASQDRFFLCIEARDPRFDGAATRRFLEELGALSVEEVPA